MTNNQKESVAISSVFASAFLTLGKFVVGITTMSIGIISEAAHSALDLGAAILTYLAVRISDQPADEKHHYGHGKTESVSALIETGLLFLTSAWIIYESFKRLFFHDVEVMVTWYAYAIVIISIIVDISRSRALNKVANETKSQALEADALHFSSDVWSSAVVMLGLIFLQLGIKGADSIAALIVALFVIYAGIRLGKRTIDVLIDAAPTGLQEKITEIANHVEGVLGIEKLRVRASGPAIFIEMIVNINRKLPLLKAQKIVKQVENELLAAYPQSDLSINFKSIPLSNETIVEKVQMVASGRNVHIHDIVVHSLEGKTDINFDMETNNNSSLKEAHDLSCLLEQEIKDELGEDVVINTHIEPADINTIVGQKVTPAEISQIESIFTAIKKNWPLIKNIHNIQIKKLDNKYFITIHCLFQKATSLEDAHNMSSKIEYLAKDKLVDIKRVVVHSEPDET